MEENAHILDYEGLVELAKSQNIRQCSGSPRKPAPTDLHVSRKRLDTPLIVTYHMRYVRRAMTNDHIIGIGSKKTFV